MKEAYFRATIIGVDGEAAKKEMRKLQMQIMQQKRELLHPSETGNVIKSIEARRWTRSRKN